jgi:MFS family permease
MGVLLILLAAQAMASMDEEILVVASPSLRNDLHVSDAELQLVLAMYTVMFAALVVTGARLGDVIGRRKAFLVGLSGFTIASLAGGLAPTGSALIAARAVQGASAALMTPQVLSIIQTQFEGEARARAIGAYSMVLAAGVAAGQVLGGLLVSMHLLSAAWRPALLLNAPIGAALLIVARRGLREATPGERRGLDLPGAALLSSALLVFVIPLSLGRDAGWPAWTWPCLGGCAVLLCAFVALERRAASGGRHPLLDLKMLTQPGIAFGAAAVTAVMACYAGFLVCLTLHLQSGLGFSAVDAGSIFTAYAAGFATASLAWTHAKARTSDRLPVIGPLTMGAALLGIGILSADGAWPLASTTPLLFCAGVGHACAFSPLSGHLTAIIRPANAADLSGLIITSSLVGQVLGVAGFVGVYLSAMASGSARAFVLTACLMAACLVPTAACAWRAMRGTRQSSSPGVLGRSDASVEHERPREAPERDRRRDGADDVLRGPAGLVEVECRSTRNLGCAPWDSNPEPAD